jgi:hypothetical protein
VPAKGGRDDGMAWKFGGGIEPDMGFVTNVVGDGVGGSMGAGFLLLLESIWSIAGLRSESRRLATLVAIFCCCIPGAI